MKNGLPSAIEQIKEIQSQIKRKSKALFLDYDGTLTRIVSDPVQAVMPESVRRKLLILSERFPVGVISGRDLADVRKLVNIPNVFCAGSHGFEISGPQGMQIAYEKGTEFLPLLDRSERSMREKMEPIPGAWVERKRFSVAVHFRKVREEDEGRVSEAVDDVWAKFPGLRRRGGRKIFELQPDIDWDKGKALLWIVERLSPKPGGLFPLYIGDDVTDEDAFQAIENRGIGIAVADRVRDTAARYRLKDPMEVERFLELLIILMP